MASLILPTLMNIAVAGLWHLGTVTAACVAAAGHTVTAYDDNTETVQRLRAGNLPVAEPGLDQMVQEETAQGRLRFTSNAADLSGSEVLWVCWDTPVDENDTADVEFVVQRVLALLPFLDARALVLISSQLPVGTTARLEAESGHRFAYSPENLRLGKAIEVFQHPDRIVAGVRTDDDRNTLQQIFRTFTDRVEWMSVESAEMTKHALNAFLATSVSFINEISTLCEKTGADALDVARGLKTDVRIGQRAYLQPGTAFAGGTLARDISFLLALGSRSKTPTSLLAGAQQSNNHHKEWALCRVEEVLGDVHGKTIAVLGLTYKPGTNTLRRSTAVEFCRLLVQRGARIQGYDPALQSLPEEAAGLLDLAPSAVDALSGADAVLISGPWPEFRALTAADFVQRMRKPVVLDPTRTLEPISSDARLRYIAIGKAT
jgi:UDPglucose 6-dehydrogenase